jgi:hypothetical protein
MLGKPEHTLIGLNFSFAGWHIRGNIGHDMAGLIVTYQSGP